jgi:hypothetical protein
MSYGTGSREEPPQPLQMPAADVDRVVDHVNLPGSRFEAHDRLLLEVLHCLRAIDDKLERLLAIVDNRLD